MFGFKKPFVQQLLKGNKEYFSRFYVQTVDVFSRYLYSRYSFGESDVQDILSDFYVKLRKVLKHFRGEYEQFAGYVRTIFKNHLSDHFKKKREQHFADFNTFDDSQSLEDTLMSSEDVSNFFAQSFDLERIRTAMEQLDEGSYEIIYLRFIESRDYRYLSLLFSVSEDVIRKRLSRALVKLRRLLS